MTVDSRPELRAIYFERFNLGDNGTVELTAEGAKIRDFREAVNGRTTYTPAGTKITRPMSELMNIFGSSLNPNITIRENAFKDNKITLMVKGGEDRVLDVRDKLYLHLTVWGRKMYADKYRSEPKKVGALAEMPLWQVAQDFGHIFEWDVMDTELPCLMEAYLPPAASTAKK